MFNLLSKSTSKGCVFMLFQLTSFAANLFTVLGGLREFNEISKDIGLPFVFWHESSWVSGFILFYGLTGLSALIWSFVADKIIGSLKANLYAVVLYLIPAAFIIYSYSDAFYSNRVVPFSLSITTIILFVLLPIFAGRVVMEAFMAPNHRD